MAARATVSGPATFASGRPARLAVSPAEELPRASPRRPAVQREDEAAAAWRLGGTGVRWRRAGEVTAAGGVAGRGGAPPAANGGARRTAREEEGARDVRGGGGERGRARRGEIGRAHV